MEKIKVHTKEERGYQIIIGKQILKKLPSLIDLSKYSKVTVLLDENMVKAGWLNELKKEAKQDIFTIKIKSGEKNKTLKTVEKIWNKMQKLGLDRKSLLINLGGGGVCDLGGFCASTYMRGIDFLQIPTTLLSQVDASVGGKTGFNLNGIKNCIGTFNKPIVVLIDVDILTTLPTREFNSGFGEILKYGISYDKKFFDYLKNLDKENLQTEELLKIIKISCEIKAKIVDKDFKETGLRKILNFGHTLGHAIESLSLKSKKPLLHGEAIAIGMVGEAYISYKLERITEKEFLKVKEIIESYNLSIKYKTNKKTEIYKLLLKDKKNISKKIKWVLMDKIGLSNIDLEIDQKVIKEAIKYITN